MVKTLTGPATTEKNAKSTFPVSLIKIGWGAPIGDKYYSSTGGDYVFDSQTWKNLVLDFGSIDLALDAEGTGRISDLRMAFQNEPGNPERISDFATSLNLIGKPVTFYQHFDGNAPADLVVLFRGRTWAPTSWSKSNANLNLAVRDETQWYNELLGNVIDLTTYPDAPRESDGRVVPVSYGQAKRVPAIPIVVKPKAELEETIMKNTGKIQLKPRFAGDDFSDWPTGAHVVKIDNEEINISSFVASTRILTVAGGGRGREIYSSETDAGTTKSIIKDATRVEIENYWVGYLLRMDEAPNLNEVREIIAWDKTAFTATMGSDFTNAQGSLLDYTVLTAVNPHQAGASVQVIDSGTPIKFLVADHPSKAVNQVLVGNTVIPSSEYVVNNNDTTYSASGQTTIEFPFYPQGIRDSFRRSAFRVDSDKDPTNSKTNNNQWARDGNLRSFAYINEEGGSNVIELPRDKSDLSKIRQKVGDIRRAFLVAKTVARNQMTPDTAKIEFKPAGGSYTDLGNLDNSNIRFNDQIDRQELDEGVSTISLMEVEKNSTFEVPWIRLSPVFFNNFGGFIKGFYLPDNNDLLDVADASFTFGINWHGDPSTTGKPSIAYTFRANQNLGMLRRGRLVTRHGAAGNAGIFTLTVTVKSGATTLDTIVLSPTTTPTTTEGTLFFWPHTDTFKSFNDNTIFVTVVASESINSSHVNTLLELWLEVQYIAMTPTIALTDQGLGSDLDAVALPDQNTGELRTAVLDITDLVTDWNDFFGASWKISYIGTTSNTNFIVAEFYVIGEAQLFEKTVSPTVWVDIDGVDSAGDGTGTLLENPSDIIKDILENRMSVSPSDIDSASFAASKATMASDNYEFAFALLRRRQSKDVLAELAWQCRCRLINEGGVYKLIYRDDAFGTADGTLSATQILPGAMTFEYDTSGIVNELVGYYSEDYTLIGNQLEAFKSITKIDSASQTAYSILKRDEQMWAIRDQATADGVLAFILSTLKDPIQTITFNTFLDFLQLERSDIISVTDPDENLTSEKFEINAVRYIPGNLRDKKMDTISFRAWRPNP